MPPALTDPQPRSLSRRRHWLGTVLALIGLAALGWLAWHLTHSPDTGLPPGTTGGAPGARSARAAPPSTVGVALAKQADIPVLVDALGTVTPIANVIVRPQVSGVITQVLYTEGQRVAKGDLLATIDPKPYENALAQASGARARDEAQLNAARVTLQRYRTLLAQDSIARQDVDTQAALVQQLEGTVTMDRANEATARLNLAYARIVAPVAGRVGLRTIDAGNYIAAGDANGVAQITQVAPIDVVFSIPQALVPEVQARAATGATLPVTAWDSTRTRQLAAGSFSTLDNQIDPQTGTVKAKARFANAEDALFPNQFVNVRLLLRTIPNAVVVPVIALRHGPNGDFVYVVNQDQTVSLRDVTRGEAGVDSVAITSGLAVGERVVTEGGDRLKDGARIQTSAERPAGAASMARAASAAGRRASGANGAWRGRHASDATSAVQ